MTSVQIGTRRLSPEAPCFLVAEIGINFNGDLDLAKRTIDAAKTAGADMVKFQSFAVEDFVPDKNLELEYISQGQPVVESQYDLFRRCELSEEDLRVLSNHCRDTGIGFHSTPTNREGIALLAELGVPVLKNGSDFLTHLDLIAAMGESGLPTVISTGMATLAEVDDAVRVFRETGNEQLIVLHCVSQYPTPPPELHMLKISALADAFDCVVGFSDHSEGNVAAVMSVVLGSRWLEKHFTLDKNLPGPDHRFSADPAEFASLVHDVRIAETALGSSALGPTTRESESRMDFRLSCAARRDLEVGTVLSQTDIAFLRPGTGYPPKHVAYLVGRRLKSAVPAGRAITLEDCD